MKLLQWVNHKFRNGSIEPLKDLRIGNPCICLSAQPSLDDQDSYMNPSFGSRYGSTSLEPPKKDLEKYFPESEAKREETSAIISELFHGFLTIGTLGSEPSVNEPATPTFATTLENLTEQKTEVTERDLKLISYELEKFLETETKEEGVRGSSARTSHVSTITLSGKQMEESEDEEHWTTVVCPLQGYLFGSSIESPETRIEAKKEKASLQELFDRTKITAENCKEKSESEEIEAKHKHKSVMHFMRRMIKKLHASSKSSTPSTVGDATDPVSLKKKLGEASDSVSTKKNPHKVGFLPTRSPKTRSQKSYLMALHHTHTHTCTYIHPCIVMIITVPFKIKLSQRNLNGALQLSAHIKDVTLTQRTNYLCEANIA